MASVVNATPGNLYIGPFTTVVSGGTLVPGIEENDIFLALDAQVRRRRSGIGSNAGPRERMGRVQAAVLLIRLRNQSATGLKMQFAHLSTDGTVMRPTGGTAAAEFSKLPVFDLLVRPRLSTEKHVYSPSWSMDEGSTWLAAHSELVAQLGGSFLALAACKPTNATGPAYEWAAAATVDTAYGLGIVP